MKSAIGFVPANEHMQTGHPESPGRMQAVSAVLETYQSPANLIRIAPVAATQERLAKVHELAMISLVREAYTQGKNHLDADTYVTAASYEQARLAAGTTCKLVDAVMAQEADNAFALIRPPGHHAESRRVGGFCLFNNIAVATRYIQAKYDLERLLIIDIDVHHGNGTQEIFYSDPDIFFISLHLYHPFFYPGSGSVEEMGKGAGFRKTLNVPFPPGAGDRSYTKAFEELVIPLSNHFEPEFILVSVGFDAHWIDPLASAGLSLTGYSIIARKILELANNLCDGRCIFVLEGGYHHQALAYGVVNILNALGGIDEAIDPLGLSPYGEPDINLLIQRLQILHLLS